MNRFLNQFLSCTVWILYIIHADVGAAVVGKIILLVCSRVLIVAKNPPNKTVELRIPQCHRYHLLNKKKMKWANRRIQKASQLLGTCNNNDIIFVLNYR